MALAAIVTATGAVVFRFLVLRRLSASSRGSIPFLEGQASRHGAWAFALLAALALPRLVLQARGFVDAGDPVWPMVANVLGTGWGRAWILQTGAAVVGVVGLVRAARGRQSGWSTAAGAAAAVALGASLMGHPAAHPAQRWIAVPTDVVHIAGVGSWVGTLFVLARICFSRDLRSEGGQTTAALVSAFHRVAVLSAVVVVATGSLSVLLRVEHLRDLPGSTYGNELFVKLFFVFVVLCVGTYNSRTAARRALNGAGVHVRGTLAAELAFVALTLAATALLVGTEPPGGM